jgi:hypothetical protein
MNLLFGVLEAVGLMFEAAAAIAAFALSVSRGRGLGSSVKGFCYGNPSLGALRSLW